MSQTSYTKDQPVAFAGLLADIGNDRIESFAVEPAAGMDFGIAAAIGTDAGNQVKLPEAGDAIRGIVCHRHVPKVKGSGEAKLLQYDTADILRQGQVWMPVSGTAPAVDAAVYAMVDTAADAGYATNAAGTNNILIPNAVCREQGVDPDGNDIVRVEINTP